MGVKGAAPKQKSVNDLIDRDAERAVIGSILLDRDASIAVGTILQSADAFGDERHRLIYQSILGLVERRTPPDLKTIASWLRERDELDLVGGIPYLLELSACVPTASHAEHYAGIVAKRYVNRLALAVSGSIAKLAVDTTLEPEQLFNQAMQELLTAAGVGVSREFVSFEVMSDEFGQLLKHAETNGGAITGVSTGFIDLDKLITGLQKGDLLILAARPSVGKTSLALNIAHSVAKTNATVAIFSIEMGREQLYQRILATETGVDMRKLRAGEVSSNDLQVITDTVGALSLLPIYVDDNGGVSLAHVQAKARRLQAERGLDLIVIDYLQLMSGSYRKDGNRVQEVSEISRGLKLLAKDLGVPVLALSQLSRAVEQRTDKTPMLSDLRESGSLEQDADIVMFIYREELYDPETDKKGIAELHVAKNRNGPTGIVPLRFFRSTTKFSNLTTYQQPEGY